MNLPTIAILVLLAVFVILDLIWLSRHGIDSCGGSCEGCSGACKWGRDIEKARKSIARQKKIRSFLHLKQ